MLVIRRRAGEAISIDGGIEIEIIEISRSRVKLGIRAPRAITVMRAEAVPVAAENRSASEFLRKHAVSEMGEILRKMRLPAKPA